MIQTRLLIERIEDAETDIRRLTPAVSTSAGPTSLRPRHMDAVLEVLDAGVDQLVREGSRHDPLVAGRLLGLAVAVGAHPMAEHVAVRNRARLAEGRVHAFRLDWCAADAAIGDLVFRPHTACEDLAAVRAAMMLDRTVRPNLVASQPALAGLFLERLLFLMSRFVDTQDRLDLVEAFGPQLAILLGDAATRARVAVASRVQEAVLSCFPPALAYLRARRTWPSRTTNPRQLFYRLRGGQPLRALLGALLGVADARSSFALSRSSLECAERPVPAGRTLVTRGTDDAGDVVMMLPGLVARARRDGAAVHCAVPGRLLPLLRGIPEVVSIESESDLPFDAYEHWISLDECAAARPDMGRGSVEVFAEALGVSAGELDRSGWSPRLALDARQRAARDAIRQEARARGWPVVGIAPFGRMQSRAVAALVDVAEQLAPTCRLLVLHTGRAEMLEAAGSCVGDAPELANLVAAIAACDYVIAADCPQLHLAAALGVPTLAVVGPTDGRIRGAASPNVRLMRQQQCPAMPCWRNDDRHCDITLGPASACLADMRAEDILGEFDALVAAHPIAGGPIRPALVAA